MSVDLVKSSRGLVFSLPTPFFVLPAGADFTNTFRSLSQISCPMEGEGEEEEEALVKQATDLLLEQCAHLEELKAANKSTMDPR